MFNIFKKYSSIDLDDASWRITNHLKNNPDLTLTDIDRDYIFKELKRGNDKPLMDFLNSR